MQRPTGACMETVSSPVERLLCSAQHQDWRHAERPLVSHRLRASPAQVWMDRRTRIYRVHIYRVHHQSMRAMRPLLARRVAGGMRP